MLRIPSAVLALVLLCACAQHGAPSTTGTPSPSPAVQGPPNAAVPAAGRAWPIPLTEEQRAAVERVVSATPSARRARLRYAMAQADDGSRRLVVYEASAKPGGPHDYVVYKVLNEADGSHYDPVQNELIAPIAREK